MDVANYYVTTLTNAAGKIGPVLIFIVVGYFVFIKLPFMFAVKVNKDNKPKPEDGKKQDPQVDLKQPQDNKIKLDSMSHQDRMNKRAQEDSDKQKKKEQGSEEERFRQQRKREEREKAKAEEEKRNKKKEEKTKQDKTPEAPAASPAAEIFELKSGEVVSKSELKKRYHELLRQNHPDKVASLGADFKKLAEKKTKEINSAYEELKKKAS